MTRTLILLYGVVVYLWFLGVFLYSVGFVGGLVVPKTIDSGPITPARTAILIDLALLGLFAVQHSVMARPIFKRWWTTVIPPAAERSTYVLATNLVLCLLFWQWRPLPAAVWSTSQPALVGTIWACFALGWAAVLISTFLIDHFDLFGLRQVFTNFFRRPPASSVFRTPVFYRFVRHPIMSGFLLAFWSAPTMSQGHLLFASVVTVYVLIALRLEEHDLVAHFGDAYVAYQRDVGMLLPLPARKSSA